MTDALRDTLHIAECRRLRLDEPQSPLLAAARTAHQNSPDRLTLLALPGTDLASAPAARHHVTTAARAWGAPPGLVDSLETVTGELAANALEHGDSWEVVVALSAAAGLLTVGVTDEGRDADALVSVRTESGPEQEHGRGLLITEALADRWGERRVPGGRTVWAEFRTEG
ncbi:hypothetical protein GCM10010329_63580 [Streptomyces spiroverticillatus]|uniref:Histidine kinase/HSP90-like ATPase domain-containing protein n=1 Tax=Streptomyces finlayi TaxID=67296 RepID=A0A919CDM3_9ACTN|nr:ATP-binding protein [Streptomyces finlayi]GHA31525.1 hypothetical protein GCM10010329_63580 [Streptomyces spiroverticillatus]GHD11056.1 hypothetical protein GCM10010334_66970 [Streptomyces finlayi]